MVTPRPKVVIAKVGLDSHYRGAVMVARFLRERGMEVVYLGNMLPEAVAASAIQEDADVIGLSSLSGNHFVMIPRLLEFLKAHGSDAIVVVGGIVPDSDAGDLLAMGVNRIFGPGSSLSAIADYITDAVRARHADSVRHT